MLIFGGGLLLCSLSMVRALVSLQPLVVVLFLLVSLLLLLWAFYRGVRAYGKGAMPVGEADIKARRQQERTFLFQVALGQVPSGIGMIIVKSGLAVMFLGWAICIWAIYKDHFSGFPLYFVCLMTLSGAILGYLAMSDWHRRRRLRRESADILAERLMLGEITEGSVGEQGCESE